MYAPFLNRFRFILFEIEYEEVNFFGGDKERAHFNSVYRMSDVVFPTLVSKSENIDINTTHPRHATEVQSTCGHTITSHGLFQLVFFHEGISRYRYTVPVHQCPLSCRLGQPQTALPHLLHNRQLDSLALRQAHPRLRPLSNLEHI